MSGVTTYEIETIAHAVEVGTKLTRSWFRGHSRICGELTPRIFRPEFDHEVLREFRPALEMEVIEAFQQEAPTAPSVPIPADDDRLGWLYLMQHYRTPTRLLDWSQNVLVALFFVVNADQKEHGELWALFPQILNQRADIGPGFPLLGNNNVVEFLVREPYWAGTPESLARDMGLDKAPKRPVAFVPNRRFDRLVRQAGAFTIHPRPKSGETIPEVVTEPEFLVRYIVRAERKRRLAEDLYNLGIDHYSLFPEMEGLARRIEHETRYLAYGPPAPPECAGAWVDP